MSTSFYFPNAKTHWLGGVFTFLFIFLSLQVHALVRYVKPTASGTGDGTTWANASGNLQAMINASGSGDEVWVAAGTYKPTSGTNRSISFSMKNGVAIYGGFNGMETQLSQRNWRTNVTTLSGDIGISGNNSDNSYSVIANEGINSAIFDGFTVTQANSTPPTGEILGGGIYNVGSSPTIRNCIFSNNTGSYAHAGIFNFNDGTPTIINCLFINNVGTVYSSGVFNFGGSANIINCTFYGNHTAISNQGGNVLSVRNCILWGNNNQFSLLLPLPTTLTVANSIVQGGWSGTGNLNTDPLFVNAAGGDFRLQACSPAIDAGNDSVNNTSTDLGGSPRKTDAYPGGAQIDLGAYEALSGDNQAPSITCPANIPCVEATSPAGAVVFYASPTAVDNCGGAVTVNAVLPSGSTFAVGLNTVVASAFDSRGNSATCSFTIQVCDRTPPTIHNMPSNISCVAATSPAGAVVTYTNPTATDIVDVVVPVTCVPASGSVFPIGSTTVVCTATDVFGNTASSSFVVSVDGTPPSITCPATQTLALGANCTATLPNYTSLATTGDDCGVQSVTQSPAAGTTVSGAGNMSVTLTVTDISGLTDNCTFTVTKVDNTAPSIICPATQTLALGANCSATLPNYTSLATTSDNCGIQSVTQSPIAGTTVSSAGNMTVTLTVTDVNGLTNSCTFTVIKVDNTAPSIICPATQTLALGANCSATLPNYTSLATTSDNCGIQGVTQSPTAGTSVSGAGNMSVTLTVTDINGNFPTQCTFTVTKVDNTAPTITCPAIQTLALGANCSATLPNYTSLASPSDNCGVQGVTQSPTAGTSVSGAGNMSVTLTVTDVNGLMNTCTFTVTKVDNTVPGIACPAPQTLVLGGSCSAALPNYTSLASPSDNCGVQSVTQSPAAGTTVSGTGNMSVTLTVTDVNGLTNTCTFTVSKVDNTPPTISCLNATVTFNGDSSLSLSATSLASASDNCGSPALSLSSPALSCAQVGQTVAVTLTATDAAGLTASCTSQVTVLGLPCGWSQQPDGIGCADGSSVSHNSGIFTLNSVNCYSAPPFTADEAAFAQHDLCGNGSITALVTSINGSGWAGISMRESNAPGARKVQLLTNLSSFSRREVRYTTGGQAYPQQFPSQNRYWLRILRQGSQFVGYVSANGSSWSQVFAVTVSMANCIEVGLVVTNNTATGSTSATFSNVSVIDNAALAAIETPDPGIETANLNINLNLNIFPNPTTGEVTVDFTPWAGQAALLEVYDLQGRRVRRLELDEATGPVPVDMSQLPSGTYLFRVGEAQQRVVLQR